MTPVELYSLGPLKTQVPTFAIFQLEYHAVFLLRAATEVQGRFPQNERKSPSQIAFKRN